jgi:cyclophilin family peptidyl-prolyl cis-trans isomerase
MTKTLFRRVHLGALTLTIAATGSSSLAQDDSPVGKPQTAPQATPDQQDARYEFVQLETSKGNILLELDRARAPITVRNFMSYVKDGTYNGTIFHRVINGFMIQGGGFTEDMVQKPTQAPIKNEWRNGLKNELGTIAMARTTNPDSATDQFFINVVDNAGLDKPISGGAGYAVFGKVVAGMDVVDTIKAVATGQKATPGGGPAMSNVPVTPIVIKKAAAVPADAARKIIAAQDKSEG